VVWLENFSGKVPGYGPTLTLTAGQVTTVVADCAWTQLGPVQPGAPLHDH
jgi:hypothetical protein